MANTKEFFLSVTQRIFSNWTALKMAVEYGMASRESVLDFCSYMTEVMYMNENLDSKEVANELEDYLDDQFNTQLEDNSGEQVATELLRFYRYCIENKESQAMEELTKLPAQQSWITTAQTVRRPRESRPQQAEDSSSEEEEEEEKEEGKVEGNMEVANDEWTEVRTRRKR